MAGLRLVGARDASDAPRHMPSTGLTRSVSRATIPSTIDVALRKGEGAMKRFLGSLIPAVIAFAPLFGQAPAKKPEFTLSLGAITEGTDLGMSVTPKYEVPFGRSGTVGYEMTMFVGYKDVTPLFAPGMLVSFEGRRASVGAGLVLPLVISLYGVEIFPPCPKFNVGFKAGSMRINVSWTTFYLLVNIFSLSLGFRI